MASKCLRSLVVCKDSNLGPSAPAASLVASILQENSGSQYLFPGNVAGERLTDIKKFWAAAIRKASIPDYRRHDNRHTYASHLVSSGLSLNQRAANAVRLQLLTGARMGHRIGAYCG